MKNKWFVIPKPNVTADLKLICFPYAGGSSSIYRPWINHLPDNVELIIVEPPGRGSRMNEPTYSNMDELTTELSKVIPKLFDKPYIFFGHSLGSRIAFELMNKLSKLSYALPQHFIASGSRGPQNKATRKKIHHLGDTEFIEEIRSLGGTPREILDNRELLNLFLPMLKADFEIAHDYCYKGNSIFNCPISVFGGQDDEIDTSSLASWEDSFSSSAEVSMFGGNHFFIDHNRVNVINEVINIVQDVLHKLSAAHRPTMFVEHSEHYHFW